MPAKADFGPDLSFGEFRLDRTDERLWGPQGPIKLGNKAFRVLAMLAETEGRLLTKDALFSSVWDGTIVSESALTSVIKELRRALGDETRTPRFIESVYGRGYRFIAPVQSNGDKTVRADSPVVDVMPAKKVHEKQDEKGRPPLVIVSEFSDEAVRDHHPWLAAAIRDEVLSGLARFREIQLVDNDRPEREMVLAHGPPSSRDYQLAARLLPDGGGVKVIARAKRLADGRVVWNEAMPLADTGLAGGVERIVRRIVAAALPAVDQDLFLGLPPDTDDFYDRYLIAKSRSFSAQDFAEARATAEALEDLIAERPDFALAYAPLVRLYNVDFGWTAFGSTGPGERARAFDLAKAGLAADRGNVHAYTVLGFCYLWHDMRDFARDCFQRAVALNPYNSVRLSEAATGLMWLGDFEQAHALFDLSETLQPYLDDLDYEDRVQLCLLENRPDEVLALVGRMSTRRLWSSLYEAICLQQSGGPEGDAKLASWRAWVASRWVGGKAPTQGQLEDWIAFHHPLASDARAAFMQMVRHAFAGLDG